MRFKRKKVVKQRGSHTHGYGSMKKHRGAGNRGGRGMAGTGKRADTIKPTIIKKYGLSYFGKRGFTSVNKFDPRVMNLNDLSQKINNLILKDKIKEKNGYFVIDGKDFGFDKLLGSGKVDKKLKVNVQSASSSAIKKIEEAGGEVVTANYGKEAQKGA
ncbi:uL15 family ribosomal protein [Candidatus Woesearchaeota archaeon]|nr:uL15 family ribosomal protein [Candidatus Woesearchaeota archaeon]